MDFDDHEDQEEEVEEMGLPVGSSYESPLVSSSRGGPGVGKIGGDDGGNLSPAATGNRKAGSGGGPKYRECLKNHAVGIGGHAVDGCGEFMAAGGEGTLDALKCAACNCHRNFHRKEVEGGGGMLGMEVGGFLPHFAPYYRTTTTTPAGYLQHHRNHHPHHVAAAADRPPPLALPSTSGGGAQSRDDQEEGVSDPMVGGESGGGVKKRFRSKFTQEQKEKMLEFAERVGWRIQKHDEAAVQQLCADACIQRHVFKVWMHNNKHTLGAGRKQP